MTNYSDSFLALTSDSRHWDTTKKIVFLGEWCKNYTDNNAENENFTICPPWRKKETDVAQYQYLQDIFAALIKALTRILNEVHEKNNSERYWQIISGAWLMHYIDVLFDRYMFIVTAANQFNNINVRCLKHFQSTLNNTFDFVNKAGEDDSYNLGLFSRLIESIEHNFTITELNYDLEPNETVTVLIPFYSKTPLKLKIKQFLMRGFTKSIKLLPFHKPTTYLYLDYFYRKATKLMSLKSFGEISSLSNPFAKTQFAFTTNNTLRTEIKFKIQSQFHDFKQDPFWVILKESISFDIPRCFLEGYKELEQKSLCFPSKCSAIFSATGWYYDEIFKIWAARKAEEGTKLLGCQHGGCYGNFQFHPAEELELSITNFYYTWGWQKPNARAIVKPMPANKLSYAIRNKAKTKNRTILLGCPNIHRYNLRFEGPIDIKTTFQNDIVFIDNLRDNLYKFLQVRIYPFYYGKDIKARFKSKFKSIQFDDCQLPLDASLKKCSVFVCDHMATTFLEALSTNMPVLLFWNKDMYPLRPEAQQYFDSLVEVNILHYDPASAAKHLNDVYDNIGEWWFEEKRQKIVAQFCRQFARTDKNALDLWVKELRSFH
jgi:putative transferase (TIGR04331 family)